ncbi:hypothetical protein ACI65C_013699 [Semiaphis heraclei]
MVKNTGNLLSLEDDSTMKKARSSIFDVSSSDDEHLSTQSNSPHTSVNQPSNSSYAHQPIAYNLQLSVSTSTYTNNEPSISTYTSKPSTSTYQSNSSITSVQPITVVGIKLDIKENNYKLTRLENTINDMKEFYRNTNNVIHQRTENKTWDFPIKALDELENFEEKLSDDQFKSNVILEKSLYVRDSVGAFVLSFTKCLTITY